MPLSMVSASHLGIHHLKRNAAESQGWSLTRSPNHQEGAQRSNSLTTQAIWKWKAKDK